LEQKPRKGRICRLFENMTPCQIGKRTIKAEGNHMAKNPDKMPPDMTALLKKLYPGVESVKDLTPEEFALFKVQVSEKIRRAKSGKE